MGRQIPALFSFNRGLVSSLALARTDNKRVNMGAEVMTNWMPRVLGPMSLRPGSAYIGATFNNAITRVLPFVFSTIDNAILELTDQLMRVWVNDALVTRPAVTTTMTNSFFSTFTTDTVTMTIATPCVITYAGADSWAVNDQVMFTTTGALPTGIVAYNRYYVLTVNTGTNAITIAATVGGAAIATSGSQSGTHTMFNMSVISGWADYDESGAQSYAGGGNLPSGLILTGTGTQSAVRDQTVVVAGGNIGVQHALRIIIGPGAPVILRVGTSTTDDSYINETTLEVGIHSLTFTPAGNFSIHFKSSAVRRAVITSCEIEAAGVMTIITPWMAANLPSIRADQSGDVVFCACEGQQQMMIQRRSTTSWSVVYFRPNDGPFSIINTSAVSLTPSALTGNITLSANTNFFKATDVGELYRLVSTGQTVQSDISAADTWTGVIRVTGVGTFRTFTVAVTGTWVGTVRVQYSLDSETGPWIDHSTLHWTLNTTSTYADGLDNQIVWYRIGIKTAEYTSGTATCRLTINTGSISGVVRVTGFTSSTSVSAEVLTNLGGTAATYNWYEGEWSDRSGWPSAVRLHEGRLWWAGKDGIWGSVSDAFASYSPDVIGDSGTINRTIGSGPVDTINWLLNLQRLIIGAQGVEFTARSSSLDEPLTPTNFNVKPASTQGSANVEPVRLDQRGVFVQRGGIKVYDVGFDMQSYDYNSKDLTAIVPELGSPGIVRMAAQRQPDTRIHCVRSDGTVMIAVYDAVEEVLAWVEYETNGFVEDLVILPGQNGSTEDQVYYVVRRVNSGGTVRYLEKWAKETEARGGTSNKQADCYVNYIGGATTVITGLGHLEGMQVCVWADGQDVGTNDNYTYIYTVNAGKITLAAPASNVVVGLPYTAQWKSSKLATQVGPTLTMLNQNKRISHLGLVLANVHGRGLRFGPDFTYLDEMPRIESGIPVSATGVRSTYDEQEFEFPTTWVTDLRLCLQAQAPRPVTVLGIAVDLEIHD